MQKITRNNTLSLCDSTLFTNDAVIYEPFSRLSAEGGEGLRDRTAMKAFFQVSAMANDGLQHSIILQESRQGKCPVSNILTHNEEGGKNTLKNVENKELVYRVLELTLIRSTNEYLYH